MLCAAYGVFEHTVKPTLPSLDTLDAAAADRMWDDFTNSRYGEDQTFPSHLECGTVPSTPWHNGVGWAVGCGVNTFTNLYVGLPSKPDGRYELRFATEGMTASSVRVYVNGRIYVANRIGDDYVAYPKVAAAKFYSKVVLVTVEWVRGFDPPSGKLRSVDLG
jgi:hypothetical protein